MLKPKLLTVMKGYHRKQFFADATAGVIVGIVALPLAIAFAIASGVTPDKGLITAVIAGFLISALGGSRVQIGGPTGAFVIIVYGIVQKYGLDGLTVATIMAGIILMIMGFARFGSMIKFIPFPVIAGFTSGIAIIIFSTQVHEFLGLTIASPPADFLGKWTAYLKNANTLNIYSLIVGTLSLAIILIWKRFSKRIPGALAAILLSSILVYFLKWPVETIGSRFGAISSMIPAPSLPRVTFPMIRDLVGPATTIAILAGIEALLSAVVADGMIGGRHRSNMELVANGVANLVTPFFGGIPATGAIARTATNIKNGGRTPIAGIIHAMVLLLIMLFFGRFASLIPLPCLAAVLMVVAYNMSEWRTFMTLLKSPRSDVMVLLTTFTLTVLVDLTVAIEVGLVMAAFLFMRRMAMVTNIDSITQEMDDTIDDTQELISRVVPKGVEVYAINGPLFFGVAHKLEEALTTTDHKPKILIIEMHRVPAIDSTGLHTLRQIIKKYKKQGITILFAQMQEQPREALDQSGLLNIIGAEQLYDSLDNALTGAQERLATHPLDGTHGKVDIALN